MSRPIPTLTPVFDRILVKRERAKAQSEGGIYIPDSAQKKLCSGIVIKAGPGERYQDRTLPMTVKEGDKILFSENVGTDINIDDCEHVVIREHDVLLIES
jgi:chaperonin GroES